MVKGHAMAQAVSHQPLTTDSWVCGWVSPCGIYGEQSGTGTGFSLSSLVFTNTLPGLHTHTHTHHLGVNNRPVGGCSSETQSYPIDIKMVLFSKL
jgi:hypothetical protein